MIHNLCNPVAVTFVGEYRACDASGCALYVEHGQIIEKAYVLIGIELSVFFAIGLLRSRIRSNTIAYNTQVIINQSDILNSAQMTPPILGDSRKLRHSWENRLVSS